MSPASPRSKSTEASPSPQAQPTTRSAYGTREPERFCASSKGVKMPSPASRRSKSTEASSSPQARTTTRSACGTRETGGCWRASNVGLGGVSFASGATGGGLIAYGSRLALSIDAASLAALIAKKGVVTMRRFALNPGYAESFVETKRDAATGELLQATVGRQRLARLPRRRLRGRRPPEPAADRGYGDGGNEVQRGSAAAEGGPMIREPDEDKRSGVVKSLSGLLMQRRAAPPDLGDAAHVLAGSSAG